MKKLHIILIIVAVIVVALGGAGYWYYQQNKMFFKMMFMGDEMYVDPMENIPQTNPMEETNPFDGYVNPFE